MQRLHIYLIAALLAGCAARTTVPGADAGNPNASTGSPLPQSPYQIRELANGLDVIVIEDHSLPIATVDIAVNTGAFTEPDELAGLSHLYEHMFFKANAVIQSQELFMKRVRQLGIVFNGYTSQEVVTYYFSLPAKNVVQGMQFMADAITSPAFKDDELVREREVVLGEFDRNEASPEFALRYALDSALWMPYVSRKQPLGQRQVIKTATVEKMNTIRERFYVPNNAALIISGDVDAAMVIAQAERMFGKWKRGADPFPTYNPPAFKPLAAQVVAREARIPDVILRMRFHGPSVGKDGNEVHTAQLFSTLIAQQTSRLYEHLADSGLVTSIQGWADNSRFTGTINFQARTSAELAPKALAALKREIAAMRSPGYFTDEEIRVAKQIINDRDKFERDNFHSFTIGTTARWWAMASLDYYERFPGVVAGITPADITAFIEKYLVGEPFVLGVGAGRETLAQLNITPEALKW